MNAPPADSSNPEPRLAATSGSVPQAWAPLRVGRSITAAALAVLALHSSDSFAQASRSAQAPAAVQPEAAPAKPNSASPPIAASTAAQIVPLGIGGTGPFGTAWYLDLRINQVVACSVIGPDQTLRCVRAEMIR